MRLTRKFLALAPDKRPQDLHLNGTGLRFETMDHCGEYPDLMPHAIKLTDALGRSCLYVPITQDGRGVDSLGYALDPEDCGWTNQ
jgi:hypothetical protein